MRRKQHGRVTRVARAALRDVVAVRIAGLNNDMVALTHAPTMSIINATDTHYIALTQIQHKWTVSLGSAAKTQTGDTYIKSVVVDWHGLYAQAEEALGEQHKELLDTVPKHQHLTSGWIASINADLITPELEYEVYEKMGVFDEFLPKWEAEK